MSSFLSVSNVLAQTGAAAPQGGMPMSMLLFYGLLFVAMYFFLIAPQRKKQKEHEKMVSSLQAGDEVITNGGIFGVITKVRDDRFEVRIADNTKVELGRGFVQAVLKSQAAAATDKK